MTGLAHASLLNAFCCIGTQVSSTALSTLRCCTATTLSVCGSYLNTRRACVKLNGYLYSNCFMNNAPLASDATGFIPKPTPAAKLWDIC